MEMPEKNSENLRRHFEAERGPIAWRELELYFANGVAIEVKLPLDLVDVAIAMALDDTAQISSWLKSGELSKVSDSRALEFVQKSAIVEAVVVKPWVIIQA